MKSALFQSTLLVVAVVFPPVSSWGAAPSTVTLDEAFRGARSKSEVLRQSDEHVSQSRARLSQLKGAVLPNLSFNVSYLLQDSPDDPIAKEFSPGSQTTTNFTLTQPLFRGFREFAGIRQQKNLTQAQESTRQQASIVLYQDVAANYLNVMSLEQDLRNLEEQSGIYERRANELGGRTRRGESSSTELLSAQSTHAAILAEIRLVQGQLQVARERFSFLTGFPRNSPLTDPQLIEGLTRVDLEKYLTRVEERPDVRAALELAQAADEGVSVAKGAHWPTVDALGNYYLKRPGFLSDSKWDLEFRLKLPIFEGGATQAQVREAASKRKEAELELERVRRLAAQDIRAWHESLSSRIAHVLALKRSSEIAERNVETSQRDFRRGLTRSIDVQLALGEYRSIRRSYDQARFAAQLDFLQLETAAALRPIRPDHLTAHP